METRSVTVGGGTKAAVLAFAICLLASPASAVTTTHTFVATYGQNSASCGDITTPCQSIYWAMAVTYDGGTITMLDEGDFGYVEATTKSYTIQGQGPGSRITPSNSINPTAYFNSPGYLVMRDLTLGGNAGPSGIDFYQGTSLTLENVVISNQFLGAGGIHFRPASASTLVMKNVTIDSSGNGNSGAAVIIEPRSGASLRVDISDSLFTKSSRGVVVQGAGNVQLSISNTTISASAGHGVYVNQTGGTTSLSIKDSQIVNNTGIGVMVYPKGSAAAKVSIIDSVVDGNNIGIRSSANGSTGTVIMAIADTSASNNAQNGVYTDGKTNANIIGSTVSGNQNGISAVAPSVVRVGDSLISGNAVGLQGPVSSYGNNQLLGNTTQGAKTPAAPGSMP